MKKLVLTLGIGLMAYTTVDAQILFQEDFDGIGGPTAGGAGTYSFPAGWFLRNVDNRTPSASVSYVNEAWERREDFNFNVADSCAFNTSWYSPAGSSDDWMWTPLIGPLPANAMLSWNAVTYDPSYPDGYEVRIMTSTQGPPTGGTGVLGNQVSNSTQVFTIAAENTSWTARSVSLNAYAGQSVYVAFRNVSNDKFLLLIDDIKVEVQLTIEAEMVSADTASNYTMMPISQTSPLSLNGTYRNNGLSPLANVFATVNVYDGTSIVYTANSSTTATLAAGSTATWTVPSFTPADTGYYTVEYIVNQASGIDQLPANDTLWQNFWVTDSTYARDDANVVGSLGIGAGNGGYLGNQFTVVNNDLLTSIGVFYTRGYVGRQYALAVWDMAGGYPNQIVAVTDTFLYPDDSADYYVLPMYNGPYAINPGEYVVTAIEFDSTVAVGLTMNVFTLNHTWVDWPTNPITPWGNNEDFGASFARTYVIRPNFGDICLNNMAMATSTPATCISCADGSASVTTSGTNGSLTYSWMPSGGNASTATGLAPGLYTVTVTDSYGCVVSDTITVGYDVCGLFTSSTTSADATCGVCADGSAQVVATGGTGPLTYLWNNGGTSDTIQNVLPGTYYVTVTDSLGCVIVDTVVVNFSTDICGINMPGAVSMFPNPSNGTFSVNVNLAASSDLTVFVTNTLGEVVATKTVNGIQNGRIEMSIDLAAGSYSLHIRSTDSEKVIPITIQK